MKAFIPILLLATSPAFAQSYFRGQITERSNDTVKWTLYNDAAHRAALLEHQSRAALHDWKRERKYDEWHQRIEDIGLHRQFTEEERDARRRNAVNRQPAKAIKRGFVPPCDFNERLAAEQARYQAAVAFFARRSHKASTRFLVDNADRCP